MKVENRWCQISRTNKSIAQEFAVGEHVVGRIKKGETYYDCITSA
jgi:hypothetical protein